MQRKFIASPNFSKRIGEEISMIVIHNISLPPGEFGESYIEDFFQNQLDISKHPYFKTLDGLKVSAHLLIKRDGKIIQFVDFKNKAWHAGDSYYAGISNINENSIGIELEGSDDTVFGSEQYQSLNIVLKELIQIYPIKYIVGHSDIAPSRKTDPGAYFEWDKLLDGAILTHYR